MDIWSAFRICVYTLLAVYLAGCGDEGASEETPCLPTPTAADCTPQYEPTFENVYKNTITLRCATGGGACHLAEGAQGNLILEGLDAAYDALVDAGRVIPGDPDCSMMIKRLFATRSTGLMPPGSPLSEPERCAVTEWVRRGATR